MNTFGTIKTKIENTAIELSKKPSFKRFIFEFNEVFLKNKDLSELYYIYDDLSSNKGLPTDIANDYINESIEYSQILLESQSRRLKEINNWINSWNDESTNNYFDIDNAIYKTGIKNLENILESKKNIKNIITKEENRKDITESSFLPISSMVKIANENLKKELGHLNENDKKELDQILSLNGEELKENFDMDESKLDEYAEEQPSRDDDGDGEVDLDEMDLDELLRELDDMEEGEDLMEGEDDLINNRGGAGNLPKPPDMVEEEEGYEDLKIVVEGEEVEREWDRTTKTYTNPLIESLIELFGDVHCIHEDLYGDEYEHLSITREDVLNY